MTKANSQPTHLSNAQLELLNAFEHEVPANVLADMQNVLTRYLAKKLTNEVDATFEENGWGEEKIEEWKHTHMRTPYRSL